MREISKLLVANRGEIAIRVLRAATELKIRTVAIYTYEDRYALHRYKADESYQIGVDEDPLKPYLDIEEIIAVAKKCGVDAIHPGYGFLSENSTFARRCAEEGIVFVGPSPDVMDQLGDKVAAKIVARACGVPLIEGNEQGLINLGHAQQEAQRISYPIILKAAAGGGGRGMRVVRSAEQLAGAFDEAKREALSAFGNDTIFIEKFIDQPKHIEVQLLGDKYGNLVHLFERDCSVQRRFQKVVEVAPAPNLRPETKSKLYEYALKIGQHVGYNNAGTVEFLLDAEENIYFIEVNPRIQVEHTVTEQITGIDIVRSQILIAEGHALDSKRIKIGSQNDIHYTGFAIQCRITTEDPANNFKPDFGTLIAYRNAGGFGIRLDEGSTYPGVKISPFFDSMLVKVTASGRTMKGTCTRLLRTLDEFRIRGVKTNIPFLANVLKHPSFQEGKATVNFIGDNPELFNYKRKQDSGTKTLKFLAEVTVNGNPDVLHKIDNKQFLPAVVPAFDRKFAPAAGTKQKLSELGPEGFAQWLKKEKAIHFTDTTLRDAHQSLLATRLRTVDMLKVAESFAYHHPDVFSMEVWGGATFDVALRFLHEDPWKRLQMIRTAVPNILLQMLIRGSNAIGYTAYPDNLVEKFIEKSWENGVDIFRIFDSLNWLESMKVSIKAVKERTQGLAEACICYTGDILDKHKSKYNLQYYLDMAMRIEDEGAHILGIKDMAGLLKPYAAEVLVGELKARLNIPIHLHTHDTSSVQAATYIKAAEAGVDVVDVALASLSGTTSQPNFNALVAAFKNTPRESTINVDSLNQFANYWELCREYYYAFESDLKAGTAEVYKHEIPGGQYTNLKPQAAAMGLLHRMPDIKKAYEEVNHLFGDIVKVTPSSKVVGDMAMYMVSNNLSANDILEKGHEISFPDSVISFFKGDLGQPYGGFPEKIQHIILKNTKPYTDLPNAHLKALDFDSEFELFKAEYPEANSFLDFLSYQFYPKVFQEYYLHLVNYGEVWHIPSPEFFYGMQHNQEIMVELAPGKTILVRLLNIGPADENGLRHVFFRLNGQTRIIDILDKNLKKDKKGNLKATAPNHVPSPMQGMISKILVKPGDKLSPGTPLFTIEAMKMETTITASLAGLVKEIALAERSLVEAEDLVLIFE